MQMLITFDVADDRRRYRLTQVLLDYGQRVQESVFWVDCDDELGERIRKRISSVISLEEDNVWLAPVCQACARKIETYGNTRKPEVPEYFIV